MLTSSKPARRRFEPYYLRWKKIDSWKCVIKCCFCPSRLTKSHIFRWRILLELLFSQSLRDLFITIWLYVKERKKGIRNVTARHLGIAWSFPVGDNTYVIYIYIYIYMSRANFSNTFLSFTYNHMVMNRSRRDWLHNNSRSIRHLKMWDLISHDNYFPLTFKWWYHKIRMCAS